LHRTTYYSFELAKTALEIAAENDGTLLSTYSHTKKSQFIFTVNSVELQKMYWWEIEKEKESEDH
jgi:hypothetical protein